MSSKYYRRYHLDIDALMDTRIGVMFDMVGEKVIDLLPTKWRERITDEFNEFLPLVDDAEYKERWKKRDRADLMMAYPTAMFLFLFDMLKDDLLEQTGASADFAGFKLTVNTYPYKLSADEMEAFRQCVAFRLEVEPQNVTMEYLPYSQMDAAWLKREEYTAIILYNLNQWLEEAFHKDSNLRGAPDTVMLCPLLFRSKVDANKLRDIDASELPTKDPTELLRYSLCTLVHLRFAPPSEFSLPDFEDLARHGIRGQVKREDDGLSV